MFYKITLSLIISVLFLFSNAFAENNAEYGTTSITDFTMYKIIPKKDPPLPENKTSPVKQVVEQKKVETPVKLKPETKPVVKKTPIIQQTTQVKTVKKEPASEAIPKQIIIKETAKDIKAELEKQKVANKEEQNTEIEQKTDKKEEFDKKKYTDKLNNLLNDLDQPEAVKNNDTVKEFSGYDYFVRPIISLGIVLFLIVLAALLYNKFRGINPNSFLSGKIDGLDVNRFKVLASSSLGQGKIIHLVEINGKQLVVGSTNNNINLLTEISPEDMEKLQAKAKTNQKTKTKEMPDKTQFSNEEDENPDQDHYSAGYADLYKEYIDKKDEK